MVTPLARRRPWKLARETVTLDHLSEGRLVLGVGLGSGLPSEWDAFAEEVEPPRRGAMLDEALAVLEGLWSGRPFSFAGRHYRVDESEFLPTPLQAPRIPIWVGAFWPHRAPLRRAARWDGCFPLFVPAGAPADVALLSEAVSVLRAERTSGAPFDVVKSAGPGTPDDRSARADLVARYAEAGATWWVDTLVPEAFGGDWGAGWPGDVMRARVREGPPHPG
jgi:alkanesulfonate monooxygenase SsuD/methylene tetrahydromethanopterin reductase-like flavin-dependent oxidoreductase (luciferase family)